MELKTLTPEQIALLKKPLPTEAVKPHPTKPFLSSIKAIYVIERLNDVFGIGSYQFENREIVKEGKMVVVESILTIPAYGIKIPSYGGNDNTDLGDAYKGAATDALTKICSYLGIGMDVFKGLSEKAEEKKTTTPAPQQNSQPVMLTDDQFNLAMKSTAKEIIATLRVFNGQNGKAMTADQNKKLVEQLASLNNKPAEQAPSAKEPEQKQTLVLDQPQSNGKPKHNF